MKIYTKQEIEAVAAHRSTVLLILPFTYDIVTTSYQSQP